MKKSGVEKMRNLLYRTTKLNERTMVSSLFFPSSFFLFLRSPCLEQLKGQTGHDDERDLRHNCRGVVVIFAKKEVIVLCRR